MAEFTRSIAAQNVALCVIQVAKEQGWLGEPVAISPVLAEVEKELFIKILGAVHERSESHGELSADEVCSLFTFVFAKAAEAVTDLYNHQTSTLDLKGMFDGHIPVYADDAITNEFRMSEFPMACAENYLSYAAEAGEMLAGYDPAVVLCEALKWCFRLSCHRANSIVEAKLG